jgi:DNA-binding response OmpR family regulator
MTEKKNLGAKILIVDDEPNVLRMVSYALDAAGFEVVVAQNGNEALIKVLTEMPDLVILDVMLPDMSGAEVCAKLRKRQDSIDLPIIMLSALAQVTDKIKGLEAGADEYITKPITPGELIARINGLLGRYHRLRQSLRKEPGKVLGFIGAKGGVGTTTVVLNVASTFVTQEKNVVAAEIRSFYGTFSAQLNLIQPQGLVNLLALDPGKIDEREVNSHLINLPSGLRLLVGPQCIAEYRDIAPQQVEKLISTFTSIADYTILDLPCHPSAANQEALRCSDFVVLVIEPESTALACGIIALNQMKSWGVHANQIGVIVVNRSPLVISIKPDQVKSALGLDVIGVIPTAAEALIASQRAGLPIILYQPNSDASKAYTEISKQLSSSKGWVK